MSLLDVNKLTIRYPNCPEPVVQDLDLTIQRGTSLGIVGESGSGKTQTALAILGLLPANAAVSGSIRFAGEELLGATEVALNRYRARRVAMIFQDPGAALNPYVSIGDQLRRILLEHKMCPQREARERTLAMLRKVGLPDPQRQYLSFPHQLSGGMRQRAMIGAALLGEPELLIADEPTTALDATVQVQILRLVADLRKESGAALLLITHDLGVVAGNCERLVVMANGKRIEEGSVMDIFKRPTETTTRALLSAAPSVRSAPMTAAIADDAAALLEVDEMAVSFGGRRNVRSARLPAVSNASFRVRHGETLALVGESGSGKTSLVRAVLGLIAADGGRVTLQGEVLPAALNARDHRTRRKLQMVFQDPLSSLNPAMSVREIVAEPLLVHESKTPLAARNEAVDALLRRVGLNAALAARYPHELSGGQAQRVAIARALILKPGILVCDEAVAALDGTVRHEILCLLAELQKDGLSIVFITHDLGVVRQISHRVLVMYMGRLCELAQNEDLFRRPRHPYSKALLNSVPLPDPEARPVEIPLAGEASSALNPPSGCLFHPRCPHAIAICKKQLPGPEVHGRTVVACHRAGELDLSY